MARINIEDSLFLDERFVFVSSKIGRFEAAGQFLYIAKLAQRYWKESKSLIPFDVFEMGEFSEHFYKSKLIEKRESGIYLKGSEDNFAWIVSQIENGRKGGRPNKNSNITKPTHNPTEPTHNPLTLTPILTPTLFKIGEEERPERTIDIFNKILGGVGRIKRYPSHCMPPKMLEKYNIFLGIKEFSKKELIEDYFRMVSTINYLTNTAPASLPWLLDPDNAIKIVSGQFQDFKKTFNVEKPQQFNQYAALIDKKIETKTNGPILDTSEINKFLENLGKN